MQRQPEQALRKPYSAPEVHRLNFEQASLFLLGHDWDGDPYARDLLELIFPPQAERPSK